MGSSRRADVFYLDRFWIIPPWTTLALSLFVFSYGPWLRWATGFVSSTGHLSYLVSVPYGLHIFSVGSLDRRPWLESFILAPGLSRIPLYTMFRTLGTALAQRSPSSSPSLGVLVSCLPLSKFKGLTWCRRPGYPAVLQLSVLLPSPQQMWMEKLLQCNVDFQMVGVGKKKVWQQERRPQEVGDRREQTGSGQRREVMGGRGRESDGRSVICYMLIIETDSEFTTSKWMSAYLLQKPPMLICFP